MTTPVSFELAKLLKEKKMPIHFSIDHKTSITTIHHYPTISDVVMWLYEKYRIWISVNREPESGVFYFSVDKNKGDFFYDKGGDFKSPTEAYEAVIEYVLNNLI